MSGVLVGAFFAGSWLVAAGASWAAFVALGLRFEPCGASESHDPATSAGEAALGPSPV